MNISEIIWLLILLVLIIIFNWHFVSWCLIWHTYITDGQTLSFLFKSLFFITIYWIGTTWDTYWQTFWAIVMNTTIFGHITYYLDIWMDVIFYDGNYYFDYYERSIATWNKFRILIYWFKLVPKWLNCHVPSFFQSYKALENEGPSFSKNGHFWMLMLMRIF